MYWIDGGPKVIRRANLDGSGVQNIVANIDIPKGLALDPAAGKMYWTETFTDGIWRADLNGLGREALITTGLERPSGIALDIGAGKMYWTETVVDRIQRANLDGSDMETILTTGKWSPDGVAIDTSAGMIYWTMPFVEGRIDRATLDGLNVETVVSDLQSPRGIALNTGTDPIPTSSVWGLIVLALTMLTAGTLLASRRRPIAR